jgi:hypothetical protein
MGIILALLAVLLLFSLGFACGYGIREWISRRRRAAEREKFHRKHPEQRR